MRNERSMTVEEFERIAPLLNGPSELVDGRLRLMSPTNYRHGLLSAKVAQILNNYLDTQPGLGDVVGAETGFRIADPRHPVQAPYAGFVRADRAPREEEGEDDPLDHFMVGAPDIAVEVCSPSESLAAVSAKAARWLVAGATQVWIIDGRHETVRVLRAASAPVLLSRTDILTAPEILPEFAVPVADIFARRR